jgi:hypothetical protein
MTLCGAPPGIPQQAEQHPLQRFGQRGIIEPTHCIRSARRDDRLVLLPCAGCGPAGRTPQVPPECFRMRLRMLISHSLLFSAAPALPGQLVEAAEGMVDALGDVVERTLWKWTGCRGSR